MADAIEPIEDDLEDDTLEDIPEDSDDDQTDYKALAAKNAGIAKRALTKLKKANEPKPEPKVAKPEPQAQTDGLNEAQLDFLDVKGYSDAEDIKIIERHVQRTGETVRQALQDDYVISKLKALKDQRDVKDATPSSTKRTGNTSGTLEQDIARFERDGTLPDDFTRASAVTNALVDKSNSSKPRWG
jgi:hypothetical protein